MEEEEKLAWEPVQESGEMEAEDQGGKDPLWWGLGELVSMSPPILAIPGGLGLKEPGWVGKGGPMEVGQ